MTSFFESYLITVPAASLVVSVIVKVLFEAIAGRLTWARAFGSGGMPSVHSALVTSITTAIGIKQGVDSDLFALSLCIASIIIYDAINVRFEAGRHAKVLNTLAQLKDAPFNEFIGHKPAEALVGSVIGIATAVSLLSA